MHNTSVILFFMHAVVEECFSGVLGWVGRGGQCNGKRRIPCQWKSKNGTEQRDHWRTANDRNGRVCVCMHVLWTYAHLLWFNFLHCSYIVASFLEVGPILLSKGIKFLLMECFSQDPVESYFGEQRSRGHRNTNPNVSQFSTTANILCVSSGLSRKERGNVRGKERDTATTSTSIFIRKRKQKCKTTVQMELSHACMNVFAHPITNLPHLSPAAGTVACVVTCPL